MKKNIYLFTTIFLFLLLPSLIYADCSDEIIKEFKEVEDEFRISYDYNKETQDYMVTLNYPSEDEYTIKPYIGGNSNCEEISDRQSKCYGLASKTYLFEIRSTKETCDDVLKSIVITIPKYNALANDPLCEGIEEFVLCDPTYDKDITYEEFVSRVNTYKKTTKPKEQQESKNKINDNKIIKYLGNNYQIITIIIAATIALVLIIILIAKNMKKSRRLE